MGGGGCSSNKGAVDERCDWLAVVEGIEMRMVMVLAMLAMVLMVLMNLSPRDDDAAKAQRRPVSGTRHLYDRPGDCLSTCE